MIFIKKKGFTLVEMICVIIIMGIIISFTTINVRNSQATARDIVRKTDLQLIANALIAYNEEYGHFPTSIYDGQTGSISAALNLITSGGEFDTDCNFKINIQDLPISTTKKNQITNYFTTKNTDNGYGSQQGGDTIKTATYKDIKESYEGITEGNLDKNDLETIESIINNTEKENIPLANTGGLNGAGTGCNFNITTQGMCTSSLKKYLVDNGYIQSIPRDPKGYSVNIQTNICFKSNTDFEGRNANEPIRLINSGDCYTKTDSGCTQVCKEGYTYISDGEHFALIAHMEGDNAGNYETTACGSCALAGTCDNENSEQQDRRKTKKRDKTYQLPCDLTDEFTNTYECMINSGLVEYNTGEYYFYIY